MRRAAFSSFVLLLGALSLRASAAPTAPARPGVELPSGIEGFSLRELEIARALPFARRGAVFRTAWLDHHFRAQSWYRPTGFDRRLLPKPELARVEAIARFQRDLSHAELERRRLRPHRTRRDSHATRSRVGQRCRENDADV